MKFPLFNRDPQGIARSSHRLKSNVDQDQSSFQFSLRALLMASFLVCVALFLFRVLGPGIFGELVLFTMFVLLWIKTRGKIICGVVLGALPCLYVAYQIAPHAMVQQSFGIFPVLFAFGGCVGGACDALCRRYYFWGSLAIVCCIVFFCVSK